MIKFSIFECLTQLFSIGVAFSKILVNLPTQRLSSHDSELFFGYMRFFSYFDHTFDNTIKATVRSILIRHYSNDLNYQLKDSKRANKAGIILTKEMNEREDNLIDCNFLSYIVKELIF